MRQHETDLVVWSEQQAELLRRMGAGERVNDLVDWENLAEEIESLGRSDRRELRGRIATIIEHLIKLRVSPAAEPRPGWTEIIIRARNDLELLIDDSPSLRPTIPDAIKAQFPRAVRNATIALSKYGERPIPGDLSFAADQVLGPWLPD